MDGKITDNYFRNSFLSRLKEDIKEEREAPFFAMIGILESIVRLRYGML